MFPPAAAIEDDWILDPLREAGKNLNFKALLGFDVLLWPPCRSSVLRGTDLNSHQGQ